MSDCLVAVFAHLWGIKNQLTVELNGTTHTAYDDPRFSTYDAAAGISKNAWTVEAYGENLSDTHANLFSFYNEYGKAMTISRPRTFGLRFSYKFSDVR